MVVIEELKLNKFIPVAIPCNKTYFSRFGETNPISSQYSGDDDLPDCQSKIDAIREADREYRDYIPPTESENE